VILFGYIFQGRGFSYFGVPPLYVGELTLALGLFALVFGVARWTFTSASVLTLLFVLFGALRTLPDLMTYRADAIRDGAIWYYAAFAFLIYFLLSQRHLDVFLRLLASATHFLLVWHLFLSTIFRSMTDSLPQFPGSPLPIISVMGPGHRGIVIGMVGAFLATGLYKHYAPHSRTPITLVWCLWIANAAIISAESRGGMLSILIPMALVLLLHPSEEWIKAITIGLVCIVVLIVWNPLFSFGYYRDFSTDQIVSNVRSIFSEDTANLGGVEGTENFRLRWWTAIYNDVIHGPHFWHGVGFGVNLASEYGVLGYGTTGEESSLRSPHNGHLTILARMGVIGIALWLALNLSFVWTLTKKCFESQDSAGRVSKLVALWFLACWSAIMIGALFDVYLEGPYGGIVYWSVIGGGLVTSRAETRESGQTAPRKFSQRNQPGTATSSSMLHARSGPMKW
jgi:hypothetical protein